MVLVIFTGLALVIATLFIYAWLQKMSPVNRYSLSLEGKEKE
jgi:hypothetical protein